MFKLFERDFFKDVGALTFSNGLSFISKFLLFILIANILGPDKYGVWIIIVTSMSYFSLFHLGILNAINREIPHNYGKNNYKENGLLVSTTFFSLSFLFLITIILGLVFNIYYQNKIYLISSILFCSSVFFRFIDIYLKSNQKFITLSFTQIFSVALLFIGIPLSSKLNLSGWITSNIISYLIPGIFLIFFLKIPLNKSGFNFKILKKLIKIGFPIMMVGLLYTLFNTIDRWIVLELLGSKSVGYYSIVIQSISICLLVPNMIADVLYPKMAESYGKYSSIKSVLNIGKLQVIYSVSTVMLLSIIIYLIFPLIINHFLPRFIEGIEAMKIILFFISFMTISYSISSILNILNRQNIVLLITLIFVFLKFSITYLLVLNYKTLEAVSYGSGISMALYALSLIITFLYLYKKEIDKKENIQV